MLKIGKKVGNNQNQPGNKQVMFQGKIYGDFKSGLWSFNWVRGSASLRLFHTT